MDDSAPDDTDLMFHRVELRVGSMIAEGEFEAFDYETYKKNDFKVKHLGDYPLQLETKPE